MRWFYALLVVVSLAVAAAAAEPGSDRAFLAEAAAAVAVEPADAVVSAELNGKGLAGKRAGMSFTKKGKVTVKQKNAERHDGKNKCENCGTETVPGEKHVKGVTPPDNEAQVDHVVPRAKGGEGSPENGQVLCRECNIQKSDKAP